MAKLHSSSSLLLAPWTQAKEAGHRRHLKQTGTASCGVGQASLNKQVNKEKEGNDPRASLPFFLITPQTSPSVFACESALKMSWSPLVFWLFKSISEPEAIDEIRLAVDEDLTS
jgi:hypothetical protein